jgi:hypothetical protein
MRPLLMLDADGVLNPFGGPCPAGFTEHDLFPGEEPVRVNPVHGTWITELAKFFDITWATGWNEEVNLTLVPLLGIAATFPVLVMPTVPFHPSGKVPLIAEFAQRRPVAWIDDAHAAEARQWSATRAEPTLLIPVSPAAGLTRAAVDQALTWARNL